MKKSKLLSLALTLALVFTTVFAGTESIFAASSQEMQAKSTDRINAVSLNSKDKADIWTVSYDQNSTTYIPVYIPKAGTFKIDLAGIDYQYGSYIKLKMAQLQRREQSAPMSTSHPLHQKELFLVKSARAAPTTLNFRPLYLVPIKPLSAYPMHRLAERSSLAHSSLEQALMERCLITK